MSGRHRSAAPGRGGGLVRRLVPPVLALAAAVALFPGGGTLAAWTDRASVAAEGMSTGRLDLAVDGAGGLDTTHARPDLALQGMVPGESSAATVVVANTGDADLRWSAGVTTDGGLGPALEVELWLGGRAGPDDTTYPRTESCTGGVRLAPGEAVRTDRGASRDLCVRVSLPVATDDAFQGRTTGSVSLRLDAMQVTTP
ncbi:SipW-dependent-type signal peptide-containing protein [Nocardioides sp. CFH 31398]|uniref:SipW-dependent-type signal peptide-containing protein n=1 Tax=Nocardioides sp. CFH 31398 TaxID=2919579 RepID=UPI001F05F320|nr:SipW-dependent-type signal peptide-containing protein [Nocardioides sp. CFH 31398]MCH1867561.1 SipW-dependent-type signal peptide-containing protein [Nocardioides sp. CFH 31398]